MNELRGVVLLAVAALAGRIVVTGELTAYVQPVMRWPLAACAAVFAALGLAEMFWRPRTQDRTLPGVGWLLVVPALVGVVVVPGPLGAFAEARSAPPAEAPADPQAIAKLQDVAAGVTPEPLAVTLLEARELAGDPLTSSVLADTEVVLIGFVSEQPPVDGVALARLAVACCAADALTVRVALDVPATPAAELFEHGGQWLRVTARFSGAHVDDPAFRSHVPLFEVVEASEIAVPKVPYEPA